MSEIQINYWSSQQLSYARLKSGKITHNFRFISFRFHCWHHIVPVDFVCFGSVHEDITGGSSYKSIVNTSWSNINILLSKLTNLFHYVLSIYLVSWKINQRVCKPASLSSMFVITAHVMLRRSGLVVKDTILATSILPVGFSAPIFPVEFLALLI